MPTLAGCYASKKLPLAYGCTRKRFVERSNRASFPLCSWAVRARQSESMSSSLRTALLAASERARGEIGRQIAENKNAWYRQALRELGKNERRYQDAITELADARDALSGAASLCVWLSSEGAATAEAAKLRGIEFRRDLGMRTCPTCIVKARTAERAVRPAPTAPTPSRPALGLRFIGGAHAS
jgi:hypothetical protein